MILAADIFSALPVDEATSLALTELPDASVATAGYGQETFYATLDNSAATPAFYRSNDQDQSWEVLEPNLNPAKVTTLTVDPHNSAVLYAGTEGGPLGEINNVWRSLDGGENWQNFNMSLPADPDEFVPAVTALKLGPNQPEVLYIGTAGHGVYRFDKVQIGFTLVGGITLPQVNVNDIVK